MLTLIVPGLIWPHQALVDLTRDLVDPRHHALPAFATLLGRGRLTRWPAAQGQSARIGWRISSACPARYLRLPCADLRWVRLWPAIRGYVLTRCICVSKARG